MIIVGIGVAIITMAAAAVYLAVRSRDVRKFLAGAFFVSGGIQFYLYLAKVSVPLLGTSYVQTPELSGVRSILHFIFFLLTFYYSFIRKEKSQSEICGRGA